MKTYTILISETHERTVDIKANSAEDAIEQALVNYQNNDIKTSPEKYTNTGFIVNFKEA